MRRLPKDGSLPPVSWLFRNPNAFRARPPKFTSKCSWCGKAFWVLANGYRVCAPCDLKDEGDG